MLKQMGFAVHAWVATAVGITLFGVASVAIASGPPTTFEPNQIEFFEKQIRPILVKRCYECHGPESKQRGGLYLDSRDSILAGGDSGPAIVAGQPDASRLIAAIRYGEKLQMPPRSKLPDREIEALTEWVRIGAPWPPTEQRAATVVDPGESVRDRAARHWAFQPLRTVDPPSVRDASWPTTDVDSFILARLEESGLTPAAPADKRTLIRRLTFDLIGLPPSPQEIDAFLADTSSRAYETLVNRLLASTHYGERWGRHWLDLVRFAETAGHEFDYEILAAYRYRDYVIRAFNDDVPFDQFVREHIAGDRLDPARRHPTLGFNESVVATGFVHLTEGTHSPVDVLGDAAERVDNQIDVISKTFLGLTVACARCHDHKFDAITMKDYYGLAGIVKSSRVHYAAIDPPERIRAKAHELSRIVADMQAPAALWITERVMATPIVRYLNAAGEVSDSDDVASIARRHTLDVETLQRWVDARTDKASEEGKQALLRLSRASDDVPRGHRDAGDVAFATFSGDDFGDWFVCGEAFGDRPTRRSEVLFSGSENRPRVRLTHGQSAHSGRFDARLHGVLRSPTFTIEKDYVQYRMRGKGGCVNLVVDGFEKIRNPIYGGLTLSPRDEHVSAWHRQDVSKWIGHRAYIEISDGSTADYTGGQTRFRDGSGFIVVDAIVFSDNEEVPVDDRAQAANHDGLDAEAIENRILAFVTARQSDASRRSTIDDDAIAGLNWMLANDLLDDTPPPARLQTKWRQFRDCVAQIDEPTLALAWTDGTGWDDRLHIRGDPATVGDAVPRRFLEALSGESDRPAQHGSGRRELAEWLIDNPLMPRVIVNRIWKHHFGHGIVRTPDDFGVMGERPTHPHLLDYLATRFVADGWSIKALHRLILSSRTYRMSSRPDSQADRLDPQNKLLHRMPVRRLEAEAIRDAMLALSGRLEPTLYGPGVMPHLTPFMIGRGRPKESGPLDGDGRRSIYINVRRNFLSPMFLAFDYPVPTSTTGRRSVSNVPAQALTMMNNPFVVEQARVWARRILAASHGSAAERIERMYVEAFGRPPDEAEMATALDFVAVAANADSAEDRLDAWSHLAHVLMNVKEFIFIP